MNLGVAGGGTGGHLFPGLAVAERARATGLAEEVVFFGAERGIESRVVPAAGFDLIAAPLEGIAGAGPLGTLRAVFRLLGAVLHARREIRRRSISVLIGLGGYASAAGVLGARLAGVPVVILEQNQNPGMSNKAFARLAFAVCTSFDGASAIFGSKARATGNPLRANLASVADYEGRSTLLIFGGSAGARTLNDAVVAALSRLQQEGEGKNPLPKVYHQTGRGSVEQVRTAYEQAGIEAEVVEFIDDMAAAYSTARLAICRAGATSVAELAETGTPAILVPYPFAAADHQTENAVAVEASGAALVVVDDDACADNLHRILGDLLPDPTRLRSMSDAARRRAQPGAVDRVLAVVAEAAGN